MQENKDQCPYLDIFHAVFIRQIELFMVNLRKFTFHHCLFLHLTLGYFLEIWRGFFKVLKLINEVIKFKKFLNPRPVDPFLIISLISLPTNISKKSFWLQAKMQGMSMCSISRYARHFLKFSFLVVTFSQYSCELLNLL